MYNEQVLPIPGCEATSRGFDCPLDNFVKIYVPSADPQIFDRLCNTSYYNKSISRQ